MRSSATAIALGLLLVACGASEPQPTTVVPIPDESATTAPGSTTTTSTVQTSSTTSMPATTSTVAEGDVPPELLALIGAPMPEVDLSFEGEEDAERWLSEFFRFALWLTANPTVDPGVLGVAYQPDTPYFSLVEAGKRNLLDAGVVFVGGELEVTSFLVDLGDYEVDLVRIEIVSRKATQSFRLDAESGSVISTSSPDPQGHRVESSLFLQRGRDGQWRLLSWDA